MADNPYSIQPTSEDAAWEARYKKWQEEEDARNAAEDAALLRAGGKLPGTWTPESQQMFTNPGMGFYPTGTGPGKTPLPEDTEPFAYQPPEAGYFERAQAELARQRADAQKFQKVVEAPSVPRTPEQAFAALDMVPAHGNVPFETPMAQTHTPLSPYTETSLRNYTQGDYNVGANVGAENYGEHKPYYDRTDILSLPNQWGINKAMRSPTAPRTDLPIPQTHGDGVVTKEASPGLESRFGDDLTLAMALMTAGTAPAMLRGAAGLGGIPKETVMGRLAPQGITDANIAERMPGLAKKLDGGILQSILGGSEVYPQNLRAYAGAATRAANNAKLNKPVQEALRAMGKVPVTPTPLDALSSTLKKLAAQKTTKSFLPYKINQQEGPRVGGVGPSFWERLNEMVPLYSDTPFGMVGP